MSNPSIKLTEKQKAVVDNLISINDEQVISLIQNFRENGELFIVQPLIEMIYSNRSQILKDAIVEFISDIRNPLVIEIITQSIQKNIENPSVVRLVTACWQSTLDFSKELPLFIDILCNSDYQISLEAFTVIENSISNVTQNNLDLYITTIESKLRDTPIEKQSLLTEMIVTLENFKRNGARQAFDDLY